MKQYVIYYINDEIEVFTANSNKEAKDEAFEIEAGNNQEEGFIIENIARVDGDYNVIEYLLKD